MSTLLPKNVWLFIWHFLKPHKVVVLLFICTAMLAGCLGPFNSMLIKHLINLLPGVKDGDGSVLVLPAVLIVLNFIVFDNFTWRFISYLTYKYMPLIKNQITLQTYQIVLASSHQFSSDNLSGRIAAQINTLADSITTILSNISANLIRGFSLVCIALITMYYVNHYFFLTLLVWFLAFSSFSIYMSKGLVKLSDIHAESESTLSGQLVDSISNISNIRNFARSTYELFNLKTPLSNSNNAFRNKEMYMIKLHCVQGALIATMQGSMLFFLVHLYQKNELTIGDFALILGLSMEVGYMTWFAMSVVDQFNELIGKCKQSISSLIVPSTVQDKENASDLLVTKGQITFDAVKFHYKGTEALFQNKTVIIKAGQKVGLVGYSGSGKSTFVNLILRLYDITDGRILIDEQDIRDVKQESLRSNIAMIPQDPSLFHRSLMENIRYGKIDATDEEVIEAAKKAHAHEFSNNLPQNYESQVGERGVKLSGGQRQRIAIARAVLKNAPILILDEATSQLDSVTEMDIQESLMELMQNKTTIVIAHRLSTLLHMDRILVFDKGKIVEDGKHSELLSKNGLYKTLWDAQVGGFLPDKQF